MQGKHDSHAQITSGTSSPFRLYVCFGLCCFPEQQKLCFLSSLNRSWQRGHDHLVSCNLSSLGKAPTKCPQNLSQFLAGEY